MAHCRAPSRASPRRLVAVAALLAASGCAQDLPAALAAAAAAAPSYWRQWAFADAAGTAWAMAPAADIAAGAKVQHGGSPLPYLKSWVLEAAGRVVAFVETEFGLATPTEPPEVSNARYPVWGWIPLFLDSLVPGGAGGDDKPFKAPAGALCFQATTFRASAVDEATGQVTITVDAAEPLREGCEDIYLLGTMSGMALLVINGTGRTSVAWDAGGPAAPQAEQWDLATHGVRLFRFLEDWPGLLYDFKETVYFMNSGDYDFGKDFMSTYAWKEFPDRGGANGALNPATDLTNGGFVGSMGFGGGGGELMAWGMGAETSHTQVVLQDDSGVWQVCESTDPVIRCTPFEEKWPYPQVNDPYSMYTYAPLNPALAAAFNTTAAWEFINSQLGFRYGYSNFIFCWIDTVNANYPCLPPFGEDGTETPGCLVWQHLQIISGMLDRLGPYYSDLFYNEAYKNRLGPGAAGLVTTAELYQYASSSKGWSPTDLITQPESDAYQYNTTYNGAPATGLSMVCDVFVCQVWKAAGVFDAIGRDSFNCMEFTNVDDYWLDVFDHGYGSTRPKACQDADPGTATCQFSGKDRLQFSPYNAKPMVPHMGEACASQNPLYAHAEDC